MKALLKNYKTLAKESSKQDDKYAPPLKPPIFKITVQEQNTIMSAATLLSKAYKNCEDEEYIKNLHLYAYQFLPNRILKLLNDFGTNFSKNQYGGIILRGLVDVDQEKLGPTPDNWKVADDRKYILYSFACTLIHGAIPSKPVQYYAQREGGGITHAIIPDKKMTNTQTGSGSKTDLYVHTEDAFLFNQADFISLMYLRNEERVPSSLYSIRSHGSMEHQFQELFEPIYKCAMDENFDIEGVSTLFAGKLTSIFYGNKKWPFLRFDAAEQIFNKKVNQSPEALQYLMKYWEAAKKLIYQEFIPDSGDLVLLNNHICAHGRSAFNAGQRMDNGKLIKCEHRFMLRMMSKTSLLNIREVTHTDDPYLIMEAHHGKLFDDLKH